MLRPELVPPYENIAVDALGDVWVGEYQPPGEEAPTYTIIDGEGRGVGCLALPPRRRPLDAVEAHPPARRSQGG
jgi:hypothetical protein